MLNTFHRSISFLLDYVTLLFNTHTNLFFEFLTQNLFFLENGGGAFYGRSTKSIDLETKYVVSGSVSQNNEVPQDFETETLEDTDDEDEEEMNGVYKLKYSLPNKWISVSLLETEAEFYNYSSVVIVIDNDLDPSALNFITSVDAYTGLKTLRLYCNCIGFNVFESEFEDRLHIVKNDTNLREIHHVREYLNDSQLAKSSPLSSLISGSSGSSSLVSVEKRKTYTNGSNESFVLVYNDDIRFLCSQVTETVIYTNDSYSFNESFTLSISLRNISLKTKSLLLKISEKNLTVENKETHLSVIKYIQ